jgi:methylenetetrahydrofolate reductase (NADPH)
MKNKIDAGCRFFQTQAIYSPEKFEDFANKTRAFGVPVMAGVVILKSAAMAKYMNENVAGITVPDSLITEMADTPKEDRKKKAVEITANIIRQVRPLCQGVHIMPLGWDELVPQIITEAELN